MKVDQGQRRPALRRMLILLGLFFVLVQVNRSAGGVLASYLGATRGLSPADIGAVMGVMFFASALVQLPTGILFDWIGPRRTLIYLGLVAISGLVVFATADGVWGLMAGRFAIGIGHGGVITAVYLIAMAWASPERVAQSTSAVIGIAGGVGGIMATAPLAYALGQFGLQATFLSVAVVTALVTLGLHFGLRDRPPDAPGAEPAQAESFGETIAGLLVVMRMPELWRIFAMGFCFTAPFMTVGGLWAGPYFIEVQGLDAATASLLLLGLVVALHLGTFCYGPLERLARSRKRLILAGVGIEIVSLGLLVIWPDAPLVVAGASLFIFAMAAPIYVVLVAHARMFVPARRAGRALTCINLAGLSGVFVLQGGTGALIDLVVRMGGAPVTGYRLAFASVIVILAVSALIYRKQPESPSA